MKDMLQVSIVVDEAEFREATGLTRFDDDPQGEFYGLLDSKMGALTDEVTAAVKEVLSRVNSKVDFAVSTAGWSTPMTERGRYERGAKGQPIPGVRRGPRGPYGKRSAK